MAVSNETQQRSDIIELLLEDHRSVEQLLGSMNSVGPAGRNELFCEIREMLVRHEVAEEEVLYPTFRSDAPGGDAIADARIAEQSEAEVMLASMEKQDTESDEFLTSFGKLRSAVLEHAQHEEAEVFPRLREVESPEKLGTMGERYEHAKQSAPTHPHPHAPDSPLGNKVLGPVAALADRMRDAMRSERSGH